MTYSNAKNLFKGVTIRLNPIPQDLHRCSNSEYLKEKKIRFTLQHSFFTYSYAVRASKIEIVECLLKSGGCEVNAQTKGSKATALHRACMKGRPEIVQLLLSKLLPLL